MPLGLHVRVGAKTCPLRPTASNKRPGTESRRSARPINCTILLKLNLIATNTIIINWTPDGKHYDLAMYFVKKLSAENSVKKLQQKVTRSSDETKNNIIKKAKQTFILMNEKKPLWFCSTCNKAYLFDNIQIQNYFLDILTSPTLDDG